MDDGRRRHVWWHDYGGYGDDEGAYDDRKRNTLWDFRPGCFKAATRAEAPIVPVVLVDSYKVYNSPTLLP